MQLLISKGVVYLLLPSDNDGFTQNFYNINVRKVILMGLPPVGCAPHFLWEYGSQNGECIEYINNVVIEFNYALRYMSSEFIRQHPDSMISYCDTFEGSVDILENRDRYGFVTTTDACCGLGNYLAWNTSLTKPVLKKPDKLLRRDHFDNELSGCRIDTALRGNRRIACTGEGFRERYPPFNGRKARSSEQA
ncbi:hypothetical protein C2845_PM16G00680 [Panicum miliaceum]|uniref:GDSL esterase/lipase n=1 Tax=Panicum miliaceum TaxID=4540 RepID=A0A3L6Q1U2_PANMI|nr:hypothetical protein C2845_PM16G00680 [Panicum miliaceum]